MKMIYSDHMSWWWLLAIALMHAFPKRLGPPVKVWWRHCENYCPHKSEPGTISLQISQTITVPVGEMGKKSSLEVDPSITKTTSGQREQLEVVQIGSLLGRAVPLTMIDTSLSLARFQCQILHLKPSESLTPHNLSQVKCVSFYEGPFVRSFMMHNR